VYPRREDPPNKRRNRQIMHAQLFTQQERPLVLPEQALDFFDTGEDGGGLVGFGEEEELVEGVCDYGGEAASTGMMRSRRREEEETGRQRRREDAERG
jgi:hypothetical protein